MVNRGRHDEAGWTIVHQLVTIYRMRLLAFILFLVTPAALWAQSGFIRADNSARNMAFTTGANAERVGNAVLVRVLTYDKNRNPIFNIGYSSRYLAACDGSWIAGPIQTAFHEGNWSAERFEADAREKEDAVPLYEIEFQRWSDTTLHFASALKPHLVSICRSAKVEPRNVHIPVASYRDDGKTPGATISVLTGTASRKGSVIDVWIRVSDTKTIPVLGRDNQPLVIAGKEQTQRESIGSYTLQRTAFDCREREIGISQATDYNENGNAIDSRSTARETLKLSSTVPNSVGEGQLDAVCSIYGTK